VVSFRRIVVGAGLALLGAAAPAAGDASDWSLRRDDGGVRVFTRPVEGSAYHEFRGTTEVRAPVERVVAWIADTERMPEWFFRCREAGLVERVSATEGYSYVVLHLPWPLAERESVSHWRITDTAAGGTVVRLENAPDRLPAHAGRVRVPRASGAWELTPGANGKLEVALQMHFEPGGRLPGWIVNTVVVDMPYWTLWNLRKLLAKGEVHPDEERLARERPRGEQPAMLPAP
jgi:hypothetical protein